MFVKALSDLQKEGAVEGQNIVLETALLCSTVMAKVVQ